VCEDRRELAGWTPKSDFLRRFFVVFKVALGDRQKNDLATFGGNKKELALKMS
jgi:hypothetical protein